MNYMEDVTDIFSLRGKKAIVIGGGLGMGESTATLLAMAGCDVAIVDIAEDRARNVADKIAGMGRRGIAVAGDVLDVNAIGPIVDDIDARLGGLDVMVSIVGQAGWYDFLDIIPEEWDLDHSRNLRYFAFAAQAVARCMVRRGRPGAITGIASVSGLQSAPRHLAYGAAKAGLVSLVKTAAVELADHGIRVNAIAPGSITTPRTIASGGAAAMVEAMRASLVPFKRSGVPDDIGKAALFLSSDLAAYMTGQTIAVDGGWTAAWTLGKRA